MADLLTDAQLLHLESQHRDGFTSSQLVAAFLDRGVHFTEANLRRYVQLGLVPRSKRVKTAGRAQGSRGVYPIRALRRINRIKSLLGEHRYTLEEIQARYLTFQDGIETVDESLTELIGRFSDKISDMPDKPQTLRLRAELDTVRKLATEMVKAVTDLEQMLQKVNDFARPRRGGAAGATELL